MTLRMKKMGSVIIIMILALCLLGVNGQEPVPVEVPEKEEETETRLNVTVIDGINDKLFELENCKVLIQGKLRLVNDLFNYTKTFLEGDRYEITISIRKKI